MDEFSISVLTEITSHFPHLLHQENKETPFLELVVHASEDAAIGGIVVQVTENKELWLRNFHPFSACEMEDAIELIDTMKGIFADEICWAMGYKEEEWIETTLFSNIEEAEMVNGATYVVLSWSGNLDKTIFEF